MRRIVFCSLVCLLLTGCAGSIARQKDTTPAASVTPILVSTPTNTPQPSPTPTPLPSDTPQPSPTLTPLLTDTPTPLPAPPATSTPAPTATGEASAGPTIHYFRANVTEADPGDTITLEWQSSGGNRAALYHLLRSYQFGRFWEVEPTGSMDYAIPAESRNWEGFELFVSDEADRTAQAGLMVTLHCPDTWFFSPAPDECPWAAIHSDGAEQHFERGTMIWVGQENRIYVLYDDSQHSPKWQIFTDEWNEGEPQRDPTLTPPPGWYQPVRGFGLVWRQHADVRSRLGWAIDQETGFSTTVQHTTRYKYNDIYLRALDGNVWRLLPESSGWEKTLAEN